MAKRKRVKLPRSVQNLERSKGERTWILVARRTQAKVLEHSGNGKRITLVDGYVNPAGHLLTRELVSDRPGRVYRSRVGLARNVALGGEQAHEHMLTTFAKQLASAVEKGVASGKCDRIILIAEPHCLGKIKKSLHPKMQKKVVATIHKDLFNLPNRELYSKLERTFR